MQRIAPLNPPFSESIQQDFDRIMPPGVPPLLLFRTVGRNARVLNRMIKGGLLDKGPLSLRQRELMILRTCANCGCRYEWGVHAALFGPKARLSKEQLADCVRPEVTPELWSAEDQLIIALADALHRYSDCPDELWRMLSESFSEEQLIELIALAGSYHTVSFLANACRVDHEAFAYRYPESR